MSLSVGNSYVNNAYANKVNLNSQDKSKVAFGTKFPVKDIIAAYGDHALNGIGSEEYYAQRRVMIALTGKDFTVERIYSILNQGKERLNELFPRLSALVKRVNEVHDPSERAVLLERVNAKVGDTKLNIQDAPVRGEIRSEESVKNGWVPLLNFLKSI